MKKLLSVLLLLPALAFAWEPTKNVTVIVGNTPGAGNEIAFRKLAEIVQKKNPKFVYVVENRPGADSVVANNKFLEAQPDGYTIKPFMAGQVPIMFAARGHTAYLKGLGFEMMEDLLPMGYDQMPVLQKIENIITIVTKGKDFIEDFYFNHLREIKHNYELINSTKVDDLVLQNIKDIL